jgi:hypothetical protein
MHGQITVGKEPTTTTTTSTGTTSTGTGAGTSTGTTSAPSTVPAPLASLLVGGTSAVKLSAPRHGASAHGSLNVASAAAGGTLEVDLLARRGALAAGAAASVRVGQLLRYYVAAGPQSFTVKLSVRARRALRAHGRLAVTAKVTLTAPGGKALSLSRPLTLRR